MGFSVRAGRKNLVRSSKLLTNTMNIQDSGATNMVLMLECGYLTDIC